VKLLGFLQIIFERQGPSFFAEFMCVTYVEDVCVTYIEGLRCLLGEQVKHLLGVRSSVGNSQVLIPAAQLSTDIIQRYALVTVTLQGKGESRLIYVEQRYRACYHNRTEENNIYH
jgi:hypothetical protein